MLQTAWKSLLQVFAKAKGEFMQLNIPCMVFNLSAILARREKSGENTQRLYISGKLPYHHIQGWNMGLKRVQINRKQGYREMFGEKGQKIQGNKTFVGSVPCTTLTNESHLYCHG